MKVLLIVWSLCFCFIGGSDVVADDKATIGPNRTAVDRDFAMPLAHWLAELASADEDRRQRAITALAEIAGWVSYTDFKEFATPQMVLEMGRSAIDDVPGEKLRQIFADRYRAELRQSLDPMIDQLRQLMIEVNAPVREEAIETLTLCIVVSWPDGSGIVRARRALPESMESDAMICWFFRYTAFTLPPDKALHSIVIPEVQRLSGMTKRNLASMWDGVEGKPWSESPLASLCLGFVPMAVLPGICQRERITTEMPLFQELLKSDYPQLIRCVSLACLCELGFWAEPALPDIRGLLRDESHLIRCLAATAIVAVAMDECIPSDLADEAGLEGEEKSKFISWAVESVDTEFDDHGLAYLESVIQDDDETAKDRLLLSSTRLYALRQVRHFRSRAQHLEPFVRECLKDPDVSVRRSAELALHAITLSFVKPKQLKSTRE